MESLFTDQRFYTCPPVSGNDLRSRHGRTQMAADLMTEIPTAVRSWWLRNQTPVLMSALGGILSPEARAELRVTSRTLKEYIELNLSSEVRLLTIVGKGGAAAPLEETSGVSDISLAQSYILAALGRKNSQIPRFQPSVWAAFSNKIQDRRRFLLFRENTAPELVDIDADASTIEGAFEVSADDLPDIELGYGAAPRPVADAIRRWAERNGIEDELIYLSGASSKTNVTVENSSITPNRRLRNLIAALEILKPQELARISIPADVVFEILKRFQD